MLPPAYPNVCNNDPSYIIGVNCTFSRKGVVKRHPASQHTSHFLNSLAKETLIYPQIIPEPDHKLLAAPYLVTPPCHVPAGSQNNPGPQQQPLSGVLLRMGQPWAGVKNDLSKAGCLGRLESLWVVSGEKERGELPDHGGLHRQF